MAKKKKIEVPLSSLTEKDLAQTSKPEGLFFRIKHSVNPGDLYAAMGCVKKLYETTGRKSIISQVVGTVANYYMGAQHPTKNAEGINVCMNDYMWDMVKPLVESQEYVAFFEKHDGQAVSIDFDVIRNKTKVNLPHGPIQGWLPLAFPDLSFDISKPWIHLNDECPEKIKKQVKGKVILNFTERYRATLIDYFFLRPYSPNLVFAGTEKEHWLFCNQWQLNIPRLEIDNFLELGYALKESMFSLSNQTQMWNLAQAMGTPRILEMCEFADNCFPNIGPNSEGYFYQAGAESNFRSMYNRFFSV